MDDSDGGFGTWMLIAGAWEAYSSMMWLHIKLLLVALLVVYHFWCGKLVKDFRDGKNRHSHTWYRWFNELPCSCWWLSCCWPCSNPFDWARPVCRRLSG